MKVSIITGSRWGGPQTWARDLSQTLNRSGVAASHTFSKWGRLAKLLLDNADVVHSTVPTLTGKSTVITVKGDYTIENNIYRKLYPVTVKRADVVTCPSRYLQNKLGLDNAVVIPNAVIPENFTVVDHRPKDTIKLMSVANSYFPGKADGLLRLKKTVLGLPCCEWHIFGAGQVPFRAKNIYFHGFVANLKELYPAFDVFLHYSMHDNFPTVILEAMASGLPVITNRIGAVAEIVSHGDDGYIAADDDAYRYLLQMLSESTEQRIKIGRNARLSVESKFDWQGIVAQYIDIYKGLVA
jgi:glycosyltransferase involved in cell wall biosynthesis